MPNWGQILAEVHEGRAAHDGVRRRYLRALHKHTGRNVIAYYSGWLQKQDVPAGYLSLNDNDKIGFMTAINGMDRSKGLDLLLHTPGGEMAATESLVAYLHQMFPDIRAVVPQLAMSAGTMISLACNTIVMGKHSSLGPFDPQIGGMPAQGIIEEFETAKREISQNPMSAPLWQVIIAKYKPTLLGQSAKASDWAEKMVSTWLQQRLLANVADPVSVATKVVEELGRHGQTKAHDRHYSAEQVRALGIPILSLEDDGKLQDAVLSVHHAFVITLAETASVKIIQDHSGSAYVTQHIAPPKKT